MTAPKNYVRYDTWLVKEAGLDDQHLSFWREEWGGYKALKPHDFSPQMNVEGLYVRDCMAFEQARQGRCNQAKLYENSLMEEMRRQGRLSLGPSPIFGPNPLDVFCD